jgi:ribosomal protein S3
MILFRRLIERTKKHRQVIDNILYIITTFYQAQQYISGYQLLLTGTIGAHGRAKAELYHEGKLSVGTLYKVFDYSSVQCVTPYGCVGLKI